MSHSLAYCLMGPTASGKTDLILSLAEHLPIDIISVDSAMIYRGMNIGTAKPSASLLAEHPHALVDICDPLDAYSVGDFYRDALSCIEISIAKNRIPFLVGGTMMYFRALERGIADLPPANLAIRKEIEMAADTHGWQALHEKLHAVDKTAAKRIHPNDKQRIGRALEVYYVTGRSITDLQKANMLPTVSFKWLAMLPSDRALLHEAIRERFVGMLQQGLIDEVTQLFARGDLSLALPSMRSVNYRQAWEYLAGNITYEAMIEKAVVATRQLAKRQMTWIRSFDQLEVLSGTNKLEQLLAITCAQSR